MSHFMRFYVFQKGELHDCGVGQRRGAKLEGDLHVIFGCNDRDEKERALIGILRNVSKVKIEISEGAS